MNKPRHYYLTLGAMILSTAGVVAFVRLFGYDLEHHHDGPAFLFLLLVFVSYVCMIAFACKWFEKHDNHRKALKAAGLTCNTRTPRQKERKVSAVPDTTKAPRRARYLYMRSYQAANNMAFFGSCAMSFLMWWGIFTGNGWLGWPSGLLTLVLGLLYVGLGKLASIGMNRQRTNRPHVPAQPAPQRVNAQILVSDADREEVIDAHVLATASERREARRQLLHALDKGALYFEEWSMRDAVTWQDWVTRRQLANVTRDLPYHRASELPSKGRRLLGFSRGDFWTLLTLVPLVTTVYWMMSLLPMGGVGMYVQTATLLCGITLGQVFAHRR